MKPKQLKNSKVLWYGVSSVILAALVLLADIGDFIGALRSIDPFYMILALLSGMASFLVWGYVWHSFFVKLGINTGKMKSYRLMLAGNFVNSITPFAQLGGEPFMAYVVSDNTDASYEKTLSAVMTSDMINILPTFTFIFVSLGYVLLFQSLQNSLKNSIYIVAILSIFVLILAYLMWFRFDLIESKLGKILDKIHEKSGRGEEIIEVLKSKIEVIRESFDEVGADRSHLIKNIGVAHLTPIAYAFSLSFILLGLGVEPNVPAVFFTVILGGIASFSPTPGGSGTVEAAFAGVLTLFYPGIGLSQAVVAAILFRACTYWPGILIGYAAMLSLKR